MNILLLNAHSPDNAGDLAILHESLHALRAAFPGATVTVAINDLQLARLPKGPHYVDAPMRWLMRVSAEGQWRWRKPLALPYALWLIGAALLHRRNVDVLPRAPERRAFMCAYYEADLVAVIGGGHMIARHALNIAFLWLWVGLALAVIMGKPLIFLPQSFGPLPGAFQQMLLRWLLNHSALIATREYRSSQFLAAIGVRQPVLTLPDIAFTARTASEADLAAAVPSLAGGTQPLVGLTLMDWGALNPSFDRQEAYEAAVVALLRHLHTRYNIHIILFAQSFGPTAAQDDRHVAHRVADAAPDVPTCIIDAELTPELLKAAYSKLDVLVATRMHSAIFALSQSVPTLLIGYVYKSVGLMEMLGLQQHVLEIDNLAADALCTSFDQLWEQRASVRTQLDHRIPAFQQTLRHLPNLIRHLWHR